MSDEPVKVFTFKQLRFNAPYTRTIRKDIQDEYDNRRYVRVEDVERLVREAFNDGHDDAVVYGMDNEGEAWEESSWPARLRAMKGK